MKLMQDKKNWNNKIEKCDLFQQRYGAVQKQIMVH